PFASGPILPRAWAAASRILGSLSLRSRIKSGTASFESDPNLPSAVVAECRTRASESLRALVKLGIASLPAGPIFPSDRAAAWRTLASGSSRASVRTGPAFAAFDPYSPSALAASKRTLASGLFRSLMRSAMDLPLPHPGSETARMDSTTPVIEIAFLMVILLTSTRARHTGGTAHLGRSALGLPMHNGGPRTVGRQWLAGSQVRPEGFRQPLQKVPHLAATSAS